MRQLLTLLLALTLAPAAYAERLPRPDHVLVVIEENRGYSQIMNMEHLDSYINALARRGMLFTQSYGVTHPSQPNYLALFSGSTQGVTSDACPYTFNNDNLATALLDKGLSYASFSETMPNIGDLGCMSGAYQRKHNPMSNWQGTRLPAEMNLRFEDFPQDFAKLPTVAFVIPDQNNDMHDGSFETADAWLKAHVGPYVEWAFKHNSLLILTWDEDNGRENNRVVTVLVGPMVKVGTSAQRIDHYSVLRTLLDFYTLPAMGAAREATAIQNVWKKH
jgi:hypothetical protein